MGVGVARRVVVTGRGGVEPEAAVVRRMGVGVGRTVAFAGGVVVGVGTGAVYGDWLTGLTVALSASFAAVDVAPHPARSTMGARAARCRFTGPSPPP